MEPEADLQNVIQTFRFPNPATTSMGIEFSSSEGSDGSDGESFGGSSDDDARFNPFRPAVRFSSEALQSHIVAIEKMMSDAGLDQEASLKQRRRSSAAAVEKFMKDRSVDEDPEPKSTKAQRESYRQSTQSLLQFILDSRQTINMAASSPLPSTNNIFRGTDFVVTNSNRMSTAISAQSNRLSYAGAMPIYGSDNDSDHSSFDSCPEEELDLVEKELMGELDYSAADESDLESSEAHDTVSSINAPSISIQSTNRNTATSATLRLLMENDPALHGLQESQADPHNAPAQPNNTTPPMFRPRPRTTLKRPSIDMTPTSPTTSVGSSSHHQTPLTSPTLAPDSKRRRSIPSMLLPTTARRPPPRTATATAAALPTPTSTTLLSIITNLPTTHFTTTTSSTSIQTILSIPPPTHPLTTTTLLSELHASAIAWRQNRPNLALTKLHACAVSPWLRNIHDPHAGGITRPTVHPSAIALYILAMCLFEGVNGVLRKDAALGVVVLEMAAGVAVEDGGGRGEEALRSVRLEMGAEGGVVADAASVVGSLESGGGSSGKGSVMGGGAAFPQRKASLKTSGTPGGLSGSMRGPLKRHEKKRTATGEEYEEKKRNVLQYFALADPAWSLIDNFNGGHHAASAPAASLSVPDEGDAPPTPRTATSSASSKATLTRKAKNRLSAMQTLTPIEFLRLPTLRLAECYELGRGIKRSQSKAAYYYQVWNALGGVGGGAADSSSRNSISSGTSSNVDSGASLASGSVRSKTLSPQQQQAPANLSPEEAAEFHQLLGNIGGVFGGGVGGLFKKKSSKRSEGK
ncbi:hypothetical protein HDU98_001751 [Podochytrium sp. JEL0797]|nr:hypothetical protein HDU98_001751 [Podochytrium sp. JEL0797]